MVVNKRKKNSRQRASTNHGWGKGCAHHKGAGSKGGRGKAGTGKRGDAKKPSIWKKRYFGKLGFIHQGVKTEIKAANLNYLNENLNNLIDKKLIQKDNDVYVVDLAKIGVNKLLATGNISNKFKITVDYASRASIEKVKKAGGEVILNKK